MNRCLIATVGALIVGLPDTAWGQTRGIQVAEKIIANMLFQEGRQVSRALVRKGAQNLERRILLPEAEEATRLLLRRLTPVAEESTLLRRFDHLQAVNDVLRGEFRGLPAAERRLAVELGEGAQKVLRRYPTEEGAALLQHLGNGGLAQAQTYGNFVVDGAHWLNSEEVLTALKSTILSPEEARAISRILSRQVVEKTLAPGLVAPLWRSVIRKTGAGAGKFWKTWVWPHKGKWLAGGLLITYLAMPQKFHDGVGRLTEWGARQLTRIGVEAVLGVGQGLVSGPLEAFRKHYFQDPAGTVLSLVLIGALLMLAIGPVRRFVWQRMIFRRWTGPQTSGKTFRGKVAHQPLRE